MADPETERRSPYQGLIPYEEADAPFFFGREKEARLIIANLFASPLTLLYGASGVGKSSVLQAGVARQLRERDDVLVIVFRSWQSNPASQLKQAILNATAEQDSAASQRAVASLPSDRLPTLNEMLTACAKQLNRRVMVILDQFEEYFVYYPQGDTFAQEFPQAVTQTDSPISFLISIREDALAKLDYFEGRIPILFDNYLRIEHLDRQSARAAIEQPIKQFNQLQPTDQQVSKSNSRLVDEVLKQVEAGKVTLGEAGQGVIKIESSEKAEAQIETPYLQLVMTRLWDEEMRAGSHRLRLETLNKLGGAKTIVRTHLDASMSAFPSDQQEIAARVFHYLVTPSGTKIAHSASDLAEYANLPKSDLAPMLETLSQSGRRILRPVDPAPDQPQAPRYEIFHDVLAPAILDWRARHVQMQKQAEAEQLAEEQRRKAEEQARIARKFRWLAIAMFVMFLLALATTTFAFVQRGRAISFADESKKLRQDGANLRKEGDDLRQKGEMAQGLAAIAQGVANDERQRAATLLELAETRKKEADLAKAEAGVERQHAEQKASETRVAFSNLLAVQSKVLAGSFPQRSLLLAAEALNATRTDDPRVPGAEEALQQALAQSGGRSFGGHEGAVNYVAISPDNRWLVTTDEIPTPSDSTNSSTETHVGYTRLWNITATGPGANSRILPNAVRPMVFSPDNHWLVAASKNSDNSKGDSFVRLWNLTASDPASPTTDLLGHKGPISTIKFSSDNRWLVTGSEDGAIYLWDLKAANFAEKPKPFRLGDTNSPVITVAISPDNRWLVTSSGDPNFCRSGIARLWDLNATDPAAKHFDLVGHRMAITEVAFSSDSQWLVTGCRGHYGSRCSDHSARLWKLKAIDPSTASITSIELPKHDGPIRAVTFSPDNHWVITGGGEIARMFDITAADPTANSRDFPDHGGPISDLTVSPNNKWLVTVTDLGDSWTKRYIVRLWDLTATNSATQPVVLSSREHPASAISISNDNHWLVTCDANNIAQVWDLTINYSVDGAGNLLNTPQVLRGHDGSIASVSFSPDSKRLVTGSNDKSARLWDLTSPRQKQIASPIALQSEHDTHFAISDDHHWLVTIGGKEAFSRTDTIAQVWDLTTQDPAYKPIVLQGHTSAIFAVAFSPDNHWLATSSHDQTARVWDLTAANPDANSIVLRGHTSVVDTIAFSPDKRWLVTGSFDGTADLWRMTPTGPEIAPAFILGDSDKAKRDKQPIFNIYTSPDSRWLVTSGSDSTPTRLWDLMAANPAVNPTILSDAYRVAISPDSHWLVTTDKTQKTARLWNLISKQSRDLPGGGYPFAFSADHHWLVTCNSDVRLWDLSAVDPIAKSVVLPKGHEKSIEAVTFSPDNHWLVTGNADNTTRLWNMKDLAASPIVLKGHTNSVYRLAISADSHWLATGSFYDKFVRLWDLTSNNPADTFQIFPINGNTSYISFSNESAGSRWLVTGNYDDRTLLLWNLRLSELKELACRTAGRNLTEDEWRTYFPGQKYRNTCQGPPVER